jgi:hypothetical protein
MLLGFYFGWALEFADRCLAWPLGRIPANYLDEHVFEFFDKGNKKADCPFPLSIGSKTFLLKRPRVVSPTRR